VTYAFLIQARLGSTRFPGKVLASINDSTVIETVYRRAQSALRATPDNIWVLTSSSPEDDRLASHLENRGIGVFRASEHDVYSRFEDHLRALPNAPDFFVRVCADNPLLEPKFIDELTRSVEAAGDSLPDYVCHVDFDGTPAPLTHYGLFAELVRTESFLRAADLDLTDYQREHVTPIIRDSNRFACCYILMPDELSGFPVRLTVDTPDDLEAVQTILDRADTNDIGWKRVIELAGQDVRLLEEMTERIASQHKG
jgi:spore coat polysaccharide biosynthesis protein SpsF (cytidylyltransferase family)